MHRRTSLLATILCHVACGPAVDGDPTPSGTEKGSTSNQPSPTSSSSTSTVLSSSGHSDSASTVTSDSTSNTADFNTTHESATCNETACPDSGSRGAACDPFSQDCPDGDKCVPWNSDGGSAWTGTKCVPVMGDKSPGTPCTAPEGPVAGIDDCAVGVICWDVDLDNQGTCVLQCTGSFDERSCPPGQACFIAAGKYVALCARSCHPLADDCLQGEVCVPGHDAFFCELKSMEPGGKVNEPCSDIGACEKGLACLSSSAASEACTLEEVGCCQPYCQLPAGDCPNPDQQCIPWYDPRLDVPVGYEDLGVCAVSPP